HLSASPLLGRPPIHARGPPPDQYLIQIMRSIVSRHRNTRSPLYLAVLSVLSAVAGCNLPDAASPEMLAGSAKASIALNMQVVSIIANAVNARVTYARTVAPLDSVTIDSTVSFKRTSTGEANWQGNRG